MWYDGFTTKFNFSKPTSTILIASLIVVSFAVVGIISIDASHGIVTKNYESGLVMPSIRDVNNPNPESSTVSGEVQGAELFVTVNDQDANLDLTEPDEVLITVNSIASGSACASTFLEETENPGEFTGIITLSSETTSGSTLEVGREDQIGMFYAPHAVVSECPDGEVEVTSEGGNTGAPRAKSTVLLESGGDVTVSELVLTPDEIMSLCFRPITQPVEISFSNGAVQTPSTDMEVSINYANSILLPGDNVNLIQMYYKEPLLGWKLVRSSHNSDGFSEDPPTITSVPDQAGFIPGLFDGVTQGQFVLGFNTGCGGGGGGGLVRPSLVVNALAGIGGSGGGGSAYSSPQLNIGNLVLLDWINVPLEVEQIVLNHDPHYPVTPYDLGYFEDFVDYPMIINDKGFILSGFTTTLETQTLKTNTPHTIKFLFYESEIIQHFSFYTNLRDTNDEIHESDTQILYNANQELQVVDPNGFFESVSLTLNELDDNKKEIVLEITFAKTMDTSHIIVRSWDPNLYSGDTNILNAWEIVSDEIIESPIITSPEPEIQELKSQTIPIWIKNNAAWWSDQQISDSDFVAGIEYLIKNGIINVPGVEVGASSTSEIPDWIQNNAGWWADSLITDEDFTEAMQWLVANGVIQI